MSNSINQHQFILEKTFELVKLIKSHINSVDIDNEETFYQLKQQLDILSCAIPESIFSKIITFVDKRLEPLALNQSSIWSENPTLEMFFAYVLTIEEEFQAIVNSNIKPLMLGK